MDLKHKGITWVGNMFQKFEAVCQEVDNIINQDTVKYVENQVSSASENMKKLYSGVVQGLHPVKNGAKGATQRERVPVNAYFKSPSHNERTTANIVNKSPASHGTTDQIDNWSQASCKVIFVNKEVAQVPNHSFLELNADLPLEKNDDVLLDKDLCENMTENAVNVLLSEKSDGTLTDQLAFVESDASDPLCHSLRDVSSEINDTNKRPSLVCDDSDLQLEDDVLLVGNNDGVITDKDASKSSEEDTTMEFNACDSLKHMANLTSCQVEVTDGGATLILDDSHLPLECSRLSEKSDDDLSDENSNEFLKPVVIMEPNATNHLNNNHLSGRNFVSKEADDSNLLLKSEVCSGRTDHALIDEDFNESPIKDPIVEDDSNRYLLNLPSNVNGVSFTYQEAIMVSDRKNQQLEHELLTRKNDDALTDKYSLKKDPIWELEHDASYPLKNQPRCTSSSIKYKDEEVSSVSNDSFLKLESEIFYGKNSEALIDEALDASCKEQANLELSTELTLHCDKELNKETLCSCDKECEDDIATPNGNPQETSIHGADVESTHKVGQASSILVKSLDDSSPKMETTSKYLENGTVYSSNARDATSSELASLVLTSRETVEETMPVSTLKSLPKGSFSVSKSLVKNVSDSTAVHDKPSDQCAVIDCESCPSFEVVSSASYENKALEMKFASSRSSLSSTESLGTHGSKVHKSAVLSKSDTCSQVEFSEPASSGALSFSTEVGCLYNSSGYLTDAGMETVDLGHKVTLKNDCDIVDYKALHAVAHRTQKLRSYKKRIQDAFTSKKRLAKEYEQLAIWYGDIDLQFSTDNSQKLGKQNGSTSYGSDSDWELL